jgi:hypothetical protein
VDPVGVVTELARRFQAGDGAGALRLFHPVTTQTWTAKASG